MRKSRYANIKKVMVDGIKFDSAHEAKRYGELKILVKCGLISSLEIHPRFKITIGGYEVRYASGRHMTYVADFSYMEGERMVIEDTKMQSGHRTEVYKIKRALMEAMGRQIREV